MNVGGERVLIAFRSVVADVSARNRIGMSAGLTLRNDGADVSVEGSSGSAAEIADWTSTTALSILRSRSSVMTMFELPAVLDEVISSTPAIAVR